MGGSDFPTLVFRIAELRSPVADPHADAHNRESSTNHPSKQNLFHIIKADMQTKEFSAMRHYHYQG
ncbi:hypothetical protein HJFPF1_04188 [Paramyrothecium foliicola]|nr:hypothetical protein HJFPF1_04188 [Paramyrothecium foliicola]